jgi:hypothetical protein
VSAPNVPFPFTTPFVQAGLPSIAAVEATNWRPSTVLRQVLAALPGGGGFYLDPLRQLHAWAGAAEPHQTNPQPLTNTLATLKTFQHRVDGTQLRKRVVVEGQRTTIRQGFETPWSDNNIGGRPVGEAWMFAPPLANGEYYRARLGSMWTLVDMIHTPKAIGVNPFAAHVVRDQPATGSGLPEQICVDAYPYDRTVIPSGWIQIGEQYLRYVDAQADAQNSAHTALLVVQGTTYLGSPWSGGQVAPINAGEIATWIDYIDGFVPMPDPGWYLGGTSGFRPGAAFHKQSVETPLALLVTAGDPNTKDTNLPAIESLVQDGRYTYPGAKERADRDLALFKDPLLSADWETDDYNAQPGRPQVINLTGVDPVSATLTITSVTITFPLRTQPPRRSCTASVFKPSTLLDVLLTTPA